MVSRLGCTVLRFAASGSSGVCLDSQGLQHGNSCTPAFALPRLQLSCSCRWSSTSWLSQSQAHVLLGRTDVGKSLGSRKHGIRRRFWSCRLWSLCYLCVMRVRVLRVSILQVPSLQAASPQKQSTCFLKGHCSIGGEGRNKNCWVSGPGPLQQGRGNYPVRLR